MVDLIKRYLTKDHNFRHKLLVWQNQSSTVYERAVAYGHIGQGVMNGVDSELYQNAMFNADNLFGTSAGKLVVGDCLVPIGRTALWGFQSGKGFTSVINHPDPILNHTSTQLAYAANEPSCAFYALAGSYFGDWNIGTTYSQVPPNLQIGNDNYLRSILTTPNYGLASMWSLRYSWRFDGMGLGDHLGGCLQRGMNFSVSQSDYSREYTILGDPALRLHVMKPPSSLNYSSGQFSWTAGEPGALYVIDYAVNRDSPFTTRVTPVPVNGTTFSPTNFTAGSYMVRALKTVVSGVGTYVNQSQGAFWP